MLRTKKHTSDPSMWPRCEKPNENQSVSSVNASSTLNSTSFFAQSINHVNLTFWWFNIKVCNLVLGSSFLSDVVVDCISHKYKQYKRSCRHQHHKQRWMRLWENTVKINIDYEYKIIDGVRYVVSLTHSQTRLAWFMCIVCSKKNWVANGLFWRNTHIFTLLIFIAKKRILIHYICNNNMIYISVVVVCTFSS